MHKKKIILCVASSLFLIGILVLAYFLPVEKNIPVEEAIAIHSPSPIIQNDSVEQSVEDVEATAETQKPQKTEESREKTASMSTQPEMPVHTKESFELKESLKPTQKISTPTPEEKPMSVSEKQKTKPEEKKNSETEKPMCILSVRCDDILNHMDKISENKRGIVPENGVILEEQTVFFSEGESVFDVLKRVLREQKIPMEYVQNPMYQSAYIEGIANIYEFDCGDTSGWLYTVNGEKPNYGCSQFEIKNGDKIEFIYQCSLY